MNYNRDNRDGQRQQPLSAWAPSRGQVPTDIITSAIIASGPAPTTGQATPSLPAIGPADTATNSPTTEVLTAGDSTHSQSVSSNASRGNADGIATPPSATNEDRWSGASDLDRVYTTWEIAPPRQAKYVSASAASSPEHYHPPSPSPAPTEHTSNRVLDRTLPLHRALSQPAAASQQVDHAGPLPPAATPLSPPLPLAYTEEGSGDSDSDVSSLRISLYEGSPARDSVSARRTGSHPDSPLVGTGVSLPHIPSLQLGDNIYSLWSTQRFSGFNAHSAELATAPPVPATPPSHPAASLNLSPASNSTTDHEDYVPTVISQRRHGYAPPPGTQIDISQVNPSDGNDADAQEANHASQSEVPTDSEGPTNSEVPIEPEVPTEDEVPTETEVPSAPVVTLQSTATTAADVFTEPEVPSAPAVTLQSTATTAADVEPEVPVTPVVTLQSTATTAANVFNETHSGSVRMSPALSANTFQASDDLCVPALRSAPGAIDDIGFAADSRFILDCCKPSHWTQSPKSQKVCRYPAVAITIQLRIEILPTLQGPLFGGIGVSVGAALLPSDITGGNRGEERVDESAGVKEGVEGQHEERCKDNDEDEGKDEGHDGERVNDWDDERDRHDGGDRARTRR